MLPLVVCWGACVQDMLDLTDLEGRREPGTHPINQGGFDLIWNNGPMQQFERPTSLPTLLGCYNPRDQNQVRKPLQALGCSQSPRFRKTRSNVSSGSGSGSAAEGRPGTGSSCRSGSGNSSSGSSGSSTTRPGSNSSSDPVGAAAERTRAGP